jgi:hypothetical protein
VPLAPLTPELALLVRQSRQAYRYALEAAIMAPSSGITRVLGALVAIMSTAYLRDNTCSLVEKNPEAWGLNTHYSATPSVVVAS